MTEEDRWEMAKRRKGVRSRRNISRARRTRTRAVLLVLSLLVLGGGCWAVMKYQVWRTAIQARLDILPDEHAKQGSLYGKAEKEVDPGNFWVLVNQVPTMEEGSQECNIEYENPSVNHYSARISLYRKDDGKLLGYTRRVDPGYYVETIQLKKKLPVGEYPVRANIELFQDETPAGTMSLEMSLRVVEAKTDQTDRNKESETG